MQTPIRPSIAELVGTWDPTRSLPAAFYTREDLFKLEMERIHLADWIFVGNTCEVPNPGDYLTYGLAGESAIVVRGEGGQLFAHHNFCRHRGSLLSTERSGHKRRFVCPYHAWSYDLDGRLFNARLMPDDFDCDGYGLQPVAVQEFAGMIFICFADEPPDFERAREAAEKYYAPYRLDRTRIAKRTTYKVRANWKIITENFRECYHCGPLHPEYCRAIISAAALGSPALAEAAKDAYAKQSARWLELGLGAPREEFRPGAWHLIDRYAYRDGYRTQSLDGGLVAPLLGDLTDPEAGVLVYTVRPNLWLEVCCDHAVTMRHSPLSPDCTEVEMTWLVRADATEGEDYDPDEVAGFWTVTGDQDWDICERVQAGVTSRRYTPGPSAPSEKMSVEWLHWYLGELMGEESYGTG